MPIQTTAVTRFGTGGAMWNRLGGDYSNKVAGVPSSGMPGSLMMMGVGMSYYGVALILPFLTNQPPGI
jgi:hypothetical protein